MPDRDLPGQWLAALQEIADRAAHEVKDSLNGVALNLEVIRSRSGRATEGMGQGTSGGGGGAEALAPFAAAASGQFEWLTERAEALLFLARTPRAGATDVAVTLKHLAALLVPAARADGGELKVEGLDRPARTLAPAIAVRLALAAGLLALTRDRGRGTCRLEADAATVVRFSHESAGTCELEPATAALIAEHDIKTERPDGRDLLLSFPGA